MELRKLTLTPDRIVVRVSFEESYVLWHNNGILIRLVRDESREVRTNFSYWKKKMQDYLIIKGQIDLIENTTAPSSIKPKEWTRKDWIARATIRMHLSESVYYTV